MVHLRPLESSDIVSGTECLLSASAGDSARNSTRTIRRFDVRTRRYIESSPAFARRRVPDASGPRRSFSPLTTDRMYSSGSFFRITMQQPQAVLITGLNWPGSSVPKTFCTCGSRSSAPNAPQCAAPGAGHSILGHVPGHRLKGIALLEPRQGVAGDSLFLGLDGLSVAEVVRIAR